MEGNYMKRHMKRWMLLTALILTAGPAALAQDPRIKIFAGTSVVPTPNIFNRVDQKQGFTGAAGFRLFGGFSPKCDVTVINSGGRTNLYLCGGEFRYAQYDHAEFFVHGMMGRIQNRATAGQTAEVGGIPLKNSSAAAALGAGFDLKGTRQFSVRLVQFDYLYGKEVLAVSKNRIRVSTGLVFRF
jgi:hypothetical protein